MSVTTSRCCGADGRDRTDTGLPPRDFKSLASTSSATSALLICIGFSRFGGNLFAKFLRVFAKSVHFASFIRVKGADDIGLALDVPGVVLSHGSRLVAEQVGLDVNNLHKEQQVWAFARRMEQGTSRGIRAAFTGVIGALATAFVGWMWLVFFSKARRTRDPLGRRPK
jgi:hypothetical protein